MYKQETVVNVFTKNPEVNYEIETYLEFKRSTSRGADSYGYPLLRLTDANYNGKSYKCTGGGYDMHGTNLGHWLQDIIKSNDLLLEAFAIDLIKSMKKDQGLPYGLNIWRDHKEKLKNAKGAWMYTRVKKAIMEKAWSLDGACGENCMKQIAELIGIKIKDQYQRSTRKGQYDKYLGSHITLTDKNTYRKLCEKHGLKLYV